ncbi:uncharacterized protein MELLADRAFT_110919 [Melampsora larici-populina 98AG31]|uniref:Uncharacterized protein n=1 Tax=Melampsora larici-populina (strain 98AG31 / pathotype 3-4-7) TaxID=747676 RepID=F4S1F8_MELLP|nr:uncharacterized protein MELLADRAFT_110919 [Melampsora larici-populina 98AG31]EGG01569.1 hypothetical protein MELLADRAFT_110919 [Melampsora larici-populina 98AG31]
MANSNQMRRRVKLVQKLWPITLAINDHRHSLFPHPIGGNRLKPALVREKDLGKAWALPPRLIQEITKEDLQVSKILKMKAKRLAKAQEVAVPTRIRLVGRFAPGAGNVTAETPVKHPLSPPTPGQLADLPPVLSEPKASQVEISSVKTPDLSKPALRRSTRIRQGPR